MLLTFSIVVLALNLCQTFTTATPVERFLRAAAAAPDNELITLQLADADTVGDLSPINVADISSINLERNKRKLPDAAFEAKNAVLGFVFGKIDNFIDTKTRVVEQLDRSNIEKNRQYDIPRPVPIPDVQTLITAVISPKIRSIGNIANDLTTGVLTTITAFSNAGSSGGGSGGSGSSGASNNNNLGNVVSKFLSFSGPILQGSSGGSAGGSASNAGGNSAGSAASNGNSNSASPPSSNSDESGY